MASRVETEVLQLRSDLEKNLDVEKVSEETIKDILHALKKVPMTLELLRSSKIGITVQGVKKAFTGTELGAEAKQILNIWRKDIGGGNNGSSSKDSSSADNIETIEKVTSKDASEVDDDELYKGMNDTRLMVMNMFQKQFEAHTEAAVAKFLAFRVESSLNSLHHSLTDSKNYMNKTKTLVFNLKKNEALRQRIVDGDMAPDQLPHLSVNDLATADVRVNREETAKNTTMARRSDLYEITRNEMLKSVGIDPNKGGEFVCRKCKGTKTSHYSLQTRSSDEPMTVFVCCLTCGNRWRTQ